MIKDRIIGNKLIMKVVFRRFIYLEKKVELIEKMHREFETQINEQKPLADGNDLAILENLELKIRHNLRVLWSRAQAGDFKIWNHALFSDGTEDGQDSWATLPEDSVVISLPGTFAPPHLEHPDLLLDALVNLSAQNRGIPKTYVAFMEPAGNQSPPPPGIEIQRLYPAQARIQMTKAAVLPFWPLIQVSSRSLKRPKTSAIQLSLDDATEYKSIGIEKLLSDHDETITLVPDENERIEKRD